MIGIVFQYGKEVVEVRVNGNDVLFRTQQFGGALAPLDAIRLDKKGVLKEFPDLKDNKEWRKEAIKRFKDKMKNYKTEKERVQYIIKDLSKFGYEPVALQQKGHRVKKIK